MRDHVIRSTWHVDATYRKRSNGVPNGKTIIFTVGLTPTLFARAAILVGVIEAASEGNFTDFAISWLHFSPNMTIKYDKILAFRHFFSITCRFEHYEIDKKEETLTLCSWNILGLDLVESRFTFTLVQLLIIIISNFWYNKSRNKIIGDILYKSQVANHKSLF